MDRKPWIHLETVTPAFIGTSNTDGAEWSAKGIRGQLRWWFRAVGGGICAGDADAVRRLEFEVFGGMATRSDDARASSLRIVAPPVASAEFVPKHGVEGRALDANALAEAWKVEQADLNTVRQRLDVAGRTNPLGYLGYGPIEYDKSVRKSVYSRGRIPERAKLSMRFQWNPEAEGTAKTIFDRALWCWTNLGGIGARSRRGFGSLVRIDAEAIKTVEDFDEAVRRNVADARDATTAEWTHFTSGTHVFRSHRFTKWEDAMTAAGAWLIAFRRRYGMSGDERARVRQRDYEWFKSNSHAEVPDRAGFGLPLPFGKSPSKQPWGAAWGEKEGRRASPLLIHIARFGADQHHVILTHIPARLVPDGEEIHFKARLNAKAAPTPRQAGIVDDFLEDLRTRAKLIEEIV